MFWSISGIKSSNSIRAESLKDENLHGGDVEKENEYKGIKL